MLKGLLKGFAKEPYIGAMVPTNQLSRVVFVIVKDEILLTLYGSMATLIVNSFNIVTNASTNIGPWAIDLGRLPATNAICWLQTELNIPLVLGNSHFSSRQAQQSVRVNDPHIPIPCEINSS